MEKNRDSVGTDLKELITQSSNKFLLNIFAGENLKDTTKRGLTLSLQFRTSLDALMRTLSACHPFFIRCVKPNEFKKPHVRIYYFIVLVLITDIFITIFLTLKQFQMFDRTLCVRQLRYSGMMETARIRSAGYPIRHGYREFVERYRHLAVGIGPAHRVDCKEASKRICLAVFQHLPDYQFGSTKIFLKDVHDVFLEAERTRMFLKHILVLQRGFRRIIFKKWILKHRNAAIMIQKNWRGRGYRREFLTIRRGIHRIQACIQSRQLAYSFSRMKKTVIGVQAHCRGYLTRHRVRGRLAQKSIRLQELMVLRNHDEKELRKAGNPNWELDAKVIYMQRYAELSKEFDLHEKIKPHQAINNHSINIEEDNKVVDDVFGFLPSSPEMEVRSKKMNGVSEMIVSFEAKSKVKKKVPTKLLSAPVNFYTYESRL